MNRVKFTYFNILLQKEFYFGPLSFLLAVLFLMAVSCMKSSLVGKQPSLFLLLKKLILVIGCKKSHFTYFYFCNYEDKRCQDQEDWTDLNISPSSHIKLEKFSSVTFNSSHGLTFLGKLLIQCCRMKRFCKLCSVRIVRIFLWFYISCWM